MVSRLSKRETGNLSKARGVLEQLEMFGSRWLLACGGRSLLLSGIRVKEEQLPLREHSSYLTGVFGKAQREGMTQP